jgi:RNA polymerase primary sigma factor
MLSREEEGEIVATIRSYKNGKRKQAAREKLFNSNLRLVIKEARYYSARCGIPFKDIISAGMEGLAVAIDRFNPEKFKTKFSTCATQWIKQRIFQLLNSLEGSVYIPRHIMHKSNMYKRIMQGCEDDPLTDKEMMDKLDVSKKQLGHIRAAKCSSVHLEIQVDNNNNNNSLYSGDISLKDVLTDSRAVTADVVLAEKERREIIDFALSQLTVVQRDILEQRYLTDEAVNLKDVGKKYDVSGERIRQIEYKALKLLRRRFKKFSAQGIRGEI